VQPVLLTSNTIQLAPLL